MEEIIRIAEAGERLTAEDLAAIQKVKAELAGRWCHRCDYCQPCPQGIPISSVLSIETFMRRMPWKSVSQMAGRFFDAARECAECHACAARCPYNLNIPELLKEKSVIWDNYVRENTAEA
jgi:predicted aldo/keto reductase-like oxidoreductase